MARIDGVLKNAQIEKKSDPSRNLDGEIWINDETGDIKYTARVGDTVTKRTIATDTTKTRQSFRVLGDIFSLAEKVTGNFYSRIAHLGETFNNFVANAVSFTPDRVISPGKLSLDILSGEDVDVPIDNATGINLGAVTSTAAATARTLGDVSSSGNARPSVFGRENVTRTAATPALAAAGYFPASDEIIGIAVANPPDLWTSPLLGFTATDEGEYWTSRNDVRVFLDSVIGPNQLFGLLVGVHKKERGAAVLYVKRENRPSFTWPSDITATFGLTGSPRVHLNVWSLDGDGTDISEFFPAIGAEGDPITWEVGQVTGGNEVGARDVQVLSVDTTAETALVLPTESFWPALSSGAVEYVKRFLVQLALTGLETFIEADSSLTLRRREFDISLADGDSALAVFAATEIGGTTNPDPRPIMIHLRPVFGSKTRLQFGQAIQLGATFTSRAMTFTMSEAVTLPTGIVSGELGISLGIFPGYYASGNGTTSITVQAVLPLVHVTPPSNLSIYGGTRVYLEGSIPGLNYSDVGVGHYLVEFDDLAVDPPAGRRFASVIGAAEATDTNRSYIDIMLNPNDTEDGSGPLTAIRSIGRVSRLYRALIGLTAERPTARPFSGRTEFKFDLSEEISGETLTGDAYILITESTGLPELDGLKVEVYSEGGA